jgi:hypothetical protein
MGVKKYCTGLNDLNALIAIPDNRQSMAMILKNQYRVKGEIEEIKKKDISLNFLFLLSHR